MGGVSDDSDLFGAGQTTPGAGKDFLVVGLGASAGGIKALKEFFSRVSPDSGAAYVVILHLSPEHESKLAEVLQPSAAIPVTQVTDHARVEPNHVYVIPPDRSLAIDDGHLALSAVTRVEERRAPVDIFFRTLAESHTSRAVCVILSGTGANGSMGMKRVKEMGGLCLVQNPDEAGYSDMPRNSIATGLVDCVLPVAEMPAKITAYKEHVESVNLSAEPPKGEGGDEQALRHIFTQLRVRTGHDFTNYKRSTVLRRVARRMSVHGLLDLPTYADFLREHREEARALLKDLLISVTNFFRDREAFETLGRDIIPKLFAGKGPDDEVRVWVAGCATGEEAYSVAMLLREYGDDAPGSPNALVFATDIDEQAVVAAREGFYTLNDAADVSPERLSRFFIKEQRGYRVRRELREMVLFAAHNIIKDPPFSRLDLATCRNLLIYFNRTAQGRVMDVLHFALNPGGYLFLGSSETVDGAGDLFVAVDKEQRIYQGRALGARLRLPVPDISLAARAGRRPAAERDREGHATERLSYADIHRRLLEQYAPPSVVVNEDYDILHMSERAGRYMRLAGGEPSRNLLRLVRPELRLELHAALQQAAQRRAGVEARGVVAGVEGGTRLVNLSVRPVLREGDAARGFFLVIFEEAGEAAEAAGPASASAAEPAARHVEEELLRVRAQFRASVEQHELRHEELKASHEELQAMNEELRTSTEELETSREELQSINEELTTVNQELKIKIEELSQANNDVRNLMNSTDIGTIFLDRALRVKLFTARARDIFNLLPADAGRPLLDLTSRLVDEDLSRDAERVLDTLQPVEREVRTREGRWYLMRLLPYRTTEERIEGVVVTFTEVTERKAAAEHLRASEERLRLLVEGVKDYAIITVTPDGRVATWNTGAERIFGYTDAEIMGRPGAVLFTPEDRERGVPEQEMRTAAAEGGAADERWHVRKDGTRFYASGVMTPLRDHEVNGFAKVARDLTAQKQEEEVRIARDQLETRVRERTGELREAITSLNAEVLEREAAEGWTRTLLRQLVTAQEEERRRISRDLHDHLGQQLTALRLKLQAVKDRPGTDAESLAQVEQAHAIARQLDADVDFLAWELRPAALDDLGLTAALSDYVAAWSKHFCTPAEFHTNGLDERRVTPEIETNLYRIAQEALNNACKHARASRVDVILECRDGNVQLIVEDDGVGFDPQAETSPGTRLGLAGMRERAALVGGTFEVESAPGGGTTVFVRVPATFPELGGC